MQAYNIHKFKFILILGTIPFIANYLLSHDIKFVLIEQNEFKRKFFSNGPTNYKKAKGL